MKGAKKHIKRLLGYKVEDHVTGFRGVVTSISFDLYGCVQAVVTPEATAERSEIKDSRWFDVARLAVVEDTRRMPLPDFDAGYVAEGRKGPAEKPLGEAR